MTVFARHPSSEALSRSLDGMLDFQAQARLREHLGVCERCRLLFRAQARVKAALRQLPLLEGNPLEQLQPPLFVPVVRPAFPFWAFAAGIAIGVALLAGLARWGPLYPPMRVISAPPLEASASRETGDELPPGEAMNTVSPGNVDLEIPHHLLLRLRPGTTVTWEELNRTGFLGGKPHIILNVMRGEVLARTQDRFWGSRLQVHTPTANATVKGTAFSVKVEPGKDATILKVLAGSVFLSPYFGKVGMNIRSGQEGEIRGRNLPSAAKELSVKERKALLETYRIGEEPQIALVIGSGSERAQDLLGPALLYVSPRVHPELPLFLRLLIAKVNAAILDGSLAGRTKEVKALEVCLKELKDPELAVPLRLFVGACDVRLGSVMSGRYHFRWVTDRFPQHPLASVAWAALGLTAEKELHNPELAQAAWQPVLSRYPGSPEAVPAKEFLHRYAPRVV